MAVPVSTREPKHNVIQSVATFSKKTVATDSTVKKSRNITRKLYGIWLWLRLRLSYLNFDTLQQLFSKNNIVNGPSKAEIRQCSSVFSCELRKANEIFSQLILPRAYKKDGYNFYHMDLCGPMRVFWLKESINGKNYGLVIVDELLSDIHGSLL
ncbi:hypothetical protein Tco_0327715 [Tanacetum coccineum]